LNLPSADEGFVLGERGLAVAETWDMGDAGGALGAGEEAWGIREAVAECRRERERGRDGWILGRIGRERAWV
jgi:hypothetical protein